MIGQIRMVCGLAILLVAASVAMAGPPLSELRTPCEQSEFKRPTTYEEMLQYLVDLRAASTDLRVGFFGESRQRQRLPYVVLSRPLVAQPWEAAVLERPVVVLAAAIHGNERTLRESLLILLRELVTPDSPVHGLLDDLVIVAVPQLNPDGFAASSSGIRGNSWGIDLNRDYTKLEHPAIASFVANIINQWHPHVVVDAHNGGAPPYNLNYLSPSHAACDPRITQLCDDEIFPHINRRLEEQGYQAFYFSKGNEKSWSIAGPEPRIGRNYIGFLNSFGILFESPGKQSLETGVQSGIVGLRAILEYVAEHPEKILDTVRQARLETLHAGLRPEGQIATTMKYEPEERSVSYQIIVGEGESQEVRTIDDGQIIKQPVPTTLRSRPYAYLLPRDAQAAVDLLRQHNIAVEVLEQEQKLEVEAYPLLEISYASVYNHQAAVRLKVDDPVTVTRTFPRGTYIVPVGQMTGRILAHLLEPETDDGVFYWNRMDAWLPKAALAAPRKDDKRGPILVPVYKLMQPTPLPSLLAE